MKIQWPKNQGEVRDITRRQMDWLLECLHVDQKKAHSDMVDTTGVETTWQVNREPGKKASSKSYIGIHRSGSCEGPPIILRIHTNPLVDQLLTGFDAPELNTLYVDRTLKGAGLIQAYSRTNRIADMQEKPWGRVVNYRWPAPNEKLMNKALAVYANKDSAILSVDEQRESNQKDGIIAKPFEDVFSEVKEVIGKLSSLTTEFQQLPPSEKQKDNMLELLREYNRGMAKLKQYAPDEVEGENVKTSLI